MKIIHRYRSTMHGNYRRASLIFGPLTGLLMALYVGGRYAVGKAVESPVSYIVDGILIVCLLLFTAFYRNALEGKKITLKEGMLFGMLTAVWAAVVYGLLLWAIGLALPEQTALFTESMTAGAQTAEGEPNGYWAAWWAIVAAVELIVLGCFAAFVSALIFRNERSEEVLKEKKKREKTE